MLAAPSPTPTPRRAGSALKQNRTEATDRNWGTRSGHQVERIGYGETDSGFGAGRTSVKSRTIEGELVAKSVSDTPSPFSIGDRVFHQKFGNGNVAAIDGNKLTIDFDKAGQKRVLDGFVQAFERAAELRLGFSGLTQQSFTSSASIRLKISLIG